MPKRLLLLAGMGRAGLGPMHGALPTGSRHRCAGEEPSPQSRRASRRPHDHCPRRGNCPGRFSVPLNNAAPRAAACPPAHAAGFGASEKHRRRPKAEPSPKVQRTHSRARDHCPRRGNRPGRFSVPLKNAAARAAACLPAHAASFGASENHRRCPAAEPSPTLPRSPSQADGSHRSAFGMTSPQGSGACSGTLSGLPSSRARTRWHCAKVVGRPPHSRAPHWHCAVWGCVQTMKTFTPNGG